MAFTNIIVLMAIRKRVFWEFEHYSDKHQQLLDDIFGNFALKPLNLCPVLIDDMWLLSLQLGNYIDKSATYH